MSINTELFKFIKDSPTAYHAVESVKAELVKNGYTELFESEEWQLSDGAGYFVTKNDSSIIAFNANKNANGFMITSSHGDSPSFRLKLSPEMTGAYTRLSVERYGGTIYYSWLDRPLSLAGRVVVRTERGIESRLVNIDRDVAVIPSVAVHVNRGVNDGYKFNAAKDLLPLAASSQGKGGVMENLAKLAGVSESDILSHDIFLYNREEGRVVGTKDEFILVPRLDDLECVFASLKAFLAAKQSDSIPVLAVFDNEETGSETKQGAGSTFLHDTLKRISQDAYERMLASSFMVSADNAHAKHPNHPELADAENAPLINDGIVIKWNANQKYATDGISDAIFSTICKRCGAKTQTFYARADMPSGTTLGPISSTKVSITTIDIGLPQLAMHSANETAGAHDLSELIKALTEFFSTSLKKTANGYEF